jgi:hypothetical protein
VLEREVRANLVFRNFTRVGSDEVPDAKTMGDGGVALGPAAIQRTLARIVRTALSARDERATTLRCSGTPSAGVGWSESQPAEFRRTGQSRSQASILHAESTMAARLQKESVVSRKSGDVHLAQSR